MKQTSSDSTFFSQPQPFLPRYQVLEKLGEGGVAVVYKVLDRKDGVEKALKALKATYNNDAKAVGRFEEEFRILRSLHHPSLPEMYDYGIARDGTRYMVMEYVAGEPLDKYFKKHSDELWLLLHQIMEALEFIHEHDLLHLDLKPGNVLVRRTRAYGGGEKPLAMLIDFGLSYHREKDEKVSVSGTPAYMAPEIISGEEKLTRAIDYYSLGVSLYELIEERLPFEGSTEEVLRAHLEREVSFASEKVEYAELYPSLRGLMSKEVPKRLEAFEELRRSVGAKLSGKMMEMERAYGMGYVESLGIIGKRELWDRLLDWIRGLSKDLRDRHEERELYKDDLTRTAPDEKLLQKDKLESEGIETASMHSADKVGIEEQMLADKSAVPDKRKTVPIDMSNYLRSPTTSRKGASRRSKELDNRELLIKLDLEMTTGEPTDLESKIKEDILRIVEEKARISQQMELKGPVKHLARVIILSGPRGSGKSVLLDALRGECLLHGMSVCALGDGGDYEELVSEDGRDAGMIGVTSEKVGQGDVKASRKPSSAIDPKSIIIDRFVRGWERLQLQGKTGGVVLITDGHEHLAPEEREFLEYVGKRLELAIDDGNEPGVFLFISGRSPRLKRALTSSMLRGEKIDSLVIPLPGHEDVESILTQFHGHMAGIEDRKRLGQYLAKHRECSGAIIEALRKALLSGALEREGGRWRFTGREEISERAKPEEEYYRLLLSGLEEKERSFLEWLSTNRGFLGRGEFLLVTGLSSTELDESLEALRPYRIVEVKEERASLLLGIGSEVVRAAIYHELSKEEREKAHKSYLEYFSERVTELEKALKMQTPTIRGKRTNKTTFRQSAHIDEKTSRARKELEELYEAVGFHYERLHEWRNALLMLVKALKQLKSEKDVFGMRRLCAEGIKLARGLRGKKWKKRKWHLERYFIKEWIEAEWMVDNYRGLIEAVRINIYQKKRQFPLSFVYKYGMALARSGEKDECKELISYAKKVPRIKCAESYTLTLLLEGTFLYSIGAHSRSLNLLNSIGHTRSLSPLHVIQIYTYIMMNYRYLGLTNQYNKYYKKVVSMANKYRLYEALTSASYTRIELLFGKSSYIRARKELKRIIRLTSRFRIYRLLHELLFLASAIYFEERNYRSALKFLGKSTQLAKDLGFTSRVVLYKSHYALIYQMLGNYGDAIRNAEYSMIQFSRNYRLPGLFYSILILLDLHLSLSSRRTYIYKRNAEALSGRIEAVYRLAYFHFLLGRYHFQKMDYNRSYYEYFKAKKLYASFNNYDDEIRSYYGLASIFLETAQYNKTFSILQQVKKKISRLESVELKAEYYKLNLAFCYLTRQNRRSLKYFLKCYENIRPEIRDANLCLDADALLFRVNARLGFVKKGMRYFKQYQKKMKEIISNLNDKTLVEDFIQNEQFSDLSRELTILNRKQKDLHSI